MTIVEDRRAVTGGVDTHAGTRVAAALDPIGGLLGVGEFPATAAGYARLLGWLGGFGTVALAGIEGTGSYGAGLARHVTAAGVRVVEAGAAPTARTAAGRASPTRWMRSAPPGLPSRAGPAARPRAATARWRRSAC
jgi:transposase